MEVKIEVYTSAQITEMCDTLASFSGFEGVQCGKCHKTANILAANASYLCECGYYNYLSLSVYAIPHENPDYGPTANVIRAGIRASERHKRIMQDINRGDYEPGKDI